MSTKQIFSRVYRPQAFTQSIVLSDGSTFTKLSTSPRPSIRLTKDIRNAALYNPDAGANLNSEENKRLAKFKGRYAGYTAEELEGTEDSAEGDLDWMVSESARAAPKMSAREMKESGSSKKKSKK